MPSNLTIGSHRHPGGLLISWDSTYDGGQQTHLMQWLPGTTQEPVGEAELVIRVLCHMLVDRIPRRGLTELIESLGEMYRFYDREAVPTVRQLPEPVTRGRTVRTMTRPVPKLEEE